MNQEHNLLIYPEEKRWLAQTENHCVFYLPGRGIVKDANAVFYFFPLCDPAFFSYGEMIDRKLLAPVSMLQEHERSQLSRLIEHNELLAPLGLCVIAFTSAAGEEALLFTSESNPESTYCMRTPEVYQLEAKHVEQLLCYCDERALQNPYCVQFDLDTVVAF